MVRRLTQGSPVPVEVRSVRPGSAWLPLAPSSEFPGPVELCGAGAGPLRQPGSPESALREGQAAPPARRSPRETRALRVGVQHRRRQLIQ